jgi:hypothetical protein
VQAGPETDPNAEDVPAVGNPLAVGPPAQAVGAPRQVRNVRGLAAADRQPAGAVAAPRVRITLERALADWDKSFPALTHDQLMRKRDEFWCGSSLVLSVFVEWRGGTKCCCAHISNIWLFDRFVPELMYEYSPTGKHVVFQVDAQIVGRL